MKSCDELFKSYCDNQNEAEMLFVFMICIEHVECKYCQSIFELRYEKKRLFVYAKTKMQISCTVTAQLISAFVFATQIVQSLYFLNPKIQAPSHLL